jgi:hypothetical protein
MFSCTWPVLKATALAGSGIWPSAGPVGQLGYGIVVSGVFLIEDLIEDLIDVTAGGAR